MKSFFYLQLFNETAKELGLVLDYLSNSRLFVEIFCSCTTGIVPKIQARKSEDVRGRTLGGEIRKKGAKERNNWHKKHVGDWCVYQCLGVCVRVCVGSN